MSEIALCSSNIAFAYAMRAISEHAQEQHVNTLLNAVLDIFIKLMDFYCSEGKKRA